jgi:hypothetical protein
LRISIKELGHLRPSCEQAIIKVSQGKFIACLMRNRLPALREPPPGTPNMPDGGGGRIGFGLVTMDRR